MEERPILTIQVILRSALGLADLTADLALQISYWAAIILTAQQSIPAPIIIGQDSRNSSDMLASALAAGITVASLWLVARANWRCG